MIYKCRHSDCSYTTDAHAFMQDHLRKEHGVAHAIRKDKETFGCSECDITFDWGLIGAAEDLDRHLKNHEIDAATGYPKESVLAEADRLVNGDRQKDYGHPLDNFTDIADLWTVVLRKNRGGEAEFSPLTAEEVALCMDLLKVSRECNTPKRDNRVDGPGYWKCLDLIIEERERRNATTALHR